MATKLKENIWNLFTIKGTKATCKTCNTTIAHFKDVRNLKIHRSRGCKIAVERANIWSQFVREGEVATCRRCNREIKHHNDIRKLKQHLSGQRCKSASCDLPPSSVRDSNLDLNEPSKVQYEQAYRYLDNRKKKWRKMTSNYTLYA
ncbi:hypothetical protein DBV15_10898 [Temnothorax longispinosus]|uniref:BED-type domain-containing protein n=1 Tax=Temnothorax longispinosus TaxID=300112 RepID=A0A4S2JP18_9HYME|nr:hypothetical protein DBV15_10898 [Temnothorax longispinosus]